MPVEELQILHKQAARRGLVFKAFPGRAVFHLTRRCSMHQRVVIGRPSPSSGAKSTSAPGSDQERGPRAAESSASRCISVVRQRRASIDTVASARERGVICRIESKREKATAERGERND